MWRAALTVASLWAFVGHEGVSWATDRDVAIDAPASPPGQPERRVALVIANSAYRSTPRLPGTINDQRAMVQALERLGFEVLVETNLDRDAIERAVLNFGDLLKDADVGLFYYSGHGVQISGKNYLVPVDASIDDPRYISLDALDLMTVLREMDDAETRLNIVVLDACRNNPFADRWIADTKATPATGLATVHASTGFLIAYATAPGDVAADGGDGASPYAKALSESIVQPGMELSAIFRGVLERVNEETGGEQRPWFESGYMGDYYFSPPAPATLVSARPAREPPRGLRGRGSVGVYVGTGLAFGDAVDASVGGVPMAEAALHWLTPVGVEGALIGPHAWFALDLEGDINLTGPYLYASDVGARATWVGLQAQLAGGWRRDALELGVATGALWPGRAPVRVVARYGAELGVQLRAGINLATDRPPEPAVDLMLSRRFWLNREPGLPTETDDQ